MDEHYKIWIIISLVSMPFAFGGFISYIVLKLLKRRIKPWLVPITILGMSGFLIPMSISTYIGKQIESEAREEIFTVLDEPNLTVRLFNSKVENSDLFIEELRKLRPMAGHHSHAIDHIEVNIKGDDKELKLLIGRDSNRPNEFWIFYPKYKHTEFNEVGRIVTNKILK